MPGERARKIRVSCVVNGAAVTCDAYPMARLLDVLREELKLSRDAQIGICLQPTDIVAVLAVCPDTEARRIIGFEAFSQVGTQRKIGLRISVGQRDVFEVIKGLFRNTGIGENRPVFLPAIKKDRGPRRRLHGGCERVVAGGRREPHQA